MSDASATPLVLVGGGKMGGARLGGRGRGALSKAGAGKPSLFAVDDES